MPVIKPILRIFDYNKAIEFYIDWIGFKIDWQNGGGNTPVYMQISLGDIIVHLSEHHGDGTPGTKIFIDNCSGLKEFHRELLNRNYKYNKPGLEAPFYDENSLEMQAHDPFGNVLIFVERDNN